MPSTLRFRHTKNYSTLGASRAVAAVLFSAIVLYPNLRLSLLFVPVAVPGIAFGLAYLAYGAWHSRGKSDNINHDAHFYGAAYGFALTYLLQPDRVLRTLRRWLSFVS